MKWVCTPLSACPFLYKKGEKISMYEEDNTPISLIIGALVLIGLLIVLLMYILLGVYHAIGDKAPEIKEEAVERVEIQEYIVDTKELKIKLIVL